MPNFTAAITALSLAFVTGHASAGLHDASLTGTLATDTVTVLTQTGSSVLNTPATGNNLFGDAATGRMALMAGATFLEGQHYRVSDLAWHATFTNTQATAQAWRFDFTLNAGEMSTTQSAFSPGDAGARLSGSVKVGGVEAWSTAAECFDRACNFAGTNIGWQSQVVSLGTTTTFGDYRGSVALGLLEPGQSVTVDYTLHAEAINTGVAVGIARIGNFAMFSGNDFSALGGVGVSPVPEPASLALMAAGLAMVAARRRS